MLQTAVKYSNNIIILMQYCNPKKYETEKWVMLKIFQ